MRTAIDTALSLRYVVPLKIEFDGHLMKSSLPRSLILLAVTAMTLVAVSADTRGEDWPQWRGPNRNGISQEKGWLTTWPAEGPKKLWEAKVGIGYSSFSVRNGRLYTMGNVQETDNVFCYDALSGKLIWKHDYPCSSKDP